MKAMDRIVGAGALGLACLGCARPQAQEGAVATPEAAAAMPGPSREARVEQALARAPQLSRAAAELLVDRAERRGGVWGDPADASLVEAARGFSRLSPAELKELGSLFGEAYATLSGDGRAAVESYVERVRRGDATDRDERSRALLGQAVKALPEARLARLQALMESSIRAGLEAERRTALAQREPPVPPAPVTRPPAWAAREDEDASYHRPGYPEPTPDHDAEDARLRAAGAAYREQLERLEESVRYAEQDVKSAERRVEQARLTPLNKRPLGDPEVNAAEERLAEAREARQRARNALDDLHTKIRRERIPQSYVQ